MILCSAAITSVAATTAPTTTSAAVAKLRAVGLAGVRAPPGIRRCRMFR
ncbi:MAG: hypothetical protein ACXVUE_07610 [Solirubrobacteraceae bacterium]